MIDLCCETSDIAPVSSMEFLDIQVTTECRFTLERVCDIIRTQSHNFLYLPGYRGS